MKKWEYKGLESYSIDISKLNELGQEGWELVTFTHSNDSEIRYIFKRELIETSSIKYGMTREQFDAMNKLGNQNIMTGTVEADTVFEKVLDDVPVKNKVGN